MRRLPARTRDLQNTLSMQSYPAPEHGADRRKPNAVHRAFTACKASKTLSPSRVTSIVRGFMQAVARDG